MNSTAVTIKPEILAELLKSANTPEGLFGPEGLLQRLKGALMEKMLEAEMTEHLGHEPNEAQGRGSGNSRNGHTSKTVHTESGSVDIRIPRDRQGTFDPKVVPKHRRRLEGFDDKVLALYATGVSVRDIQAHLRELYGTDVSPELISRVTDGALDEAKAWQQRPLDAVYPIVYLDALFVSIRDGGTVMKKAVYIALGMTLDGHRDVLGFWIEQTEGARFWLSVLTDLKNRGVDDIFFVCCDGLSGFPQAVEAAFPKAVVQTCIVHMIRASLRYVAYADKKRIVRDLRGIYGAENELAARAGLVTVEENWGAKYPTVIRMWTTRWVEIVPFLAYPKEIRKILYTTNIIESLNFQLRKVLRPKGHFPNDEAVMKLLFLALQRAKLHWKSPIHWKQALAHFAIVFGDRLPA
jgi:putative transposase